MKTRRPLLIGSIAFCLLLACQTLTQSSVATSTPLPTQTAAIPTVVPTQKTSFINMEGDFVDDHGVPMMLVPEGDFIMGR